MELTKIHRNRVVKDRQRFELEICLVDLEKKTQFNTKEKNC